MKIYRVDFEPFWPVPCGLIISANSMEQAKEIAKQTISHPSAWVEITELDASIPNVLFYESGDY